MPRIARVLLPNYPPLVVQRGHNPQAVFALETFKPIDDVNVYGFCLMTNHVHLIVGLDHRLAKNHAYGRDIDCNLLFLQGCYTSAEPSSPNDDQGLIVQPGEAVANLGQLMKPLAGRQTRFVNRQESRRGTLWEGRYQSSPIETDAYLLTGCRYVELNAVRAGTKDRPSAYAWSSYGWHTGEGSDYSWLDPNPCYEALGSTAEQRALQYRDLVRSAIPDGEWALIREALQRGQLLCQFS
jgi:putative transposase